MIEAAAIALHDIDCTDKTCSATIMGSVYAPRARRVLAAALDVCEVREEPGMRQVNAERPELGGDLWADDCPSGRYFQEAVKSWADMAAAGDAGPWSHSLLRRLHFTTPAEQVDTEGATT